MNTKLDASVVLALALGCFAFPANANMKYTPEFTNIWCSATTFAAPVAGDEVGGSGTGGGWEVVPSGGVEVESSKLSIDTDVSAPLVYTNNAAAGIYSIVATLSVTLSSELPTLSSAKTAICVCTNGVVGAGAATNWWALINNTWTNLTCGTPVVDADYEIVLDSDTAAGKIRYRAKKLSAPAEADYTDLTGGWVANSASSEPISKISFAGSTTLAEFSGENFQQGYAYNGEVYGSTAEAASAASKDEEAHDFCIPVATGGVTVASATIPASWIYANGSGADLAAKVTNLDSNGANGMTYWQSYVLGLVPSIDASKPIALPVQDAKPGKATFALGSAVARPSAGVPVKYRVNTYNTIGGDATYGDYVNADANAEVDLPPSGVKYYKIDVKFGE